MALYTGISAAGEARQHNGDVNNTQTTYYTVRQRRSDETLREDDRNKRLLKAGAEGQTKRVEYLIRIGADIDYSDEDDLTALHHAALSGFEDTVEALLAVGCDVNAFSESHGTPLCLAAIKARHRVLEVLIKARAKLDAPGGYLGSALHAACASGDSAVVRSLIRHGVEVNLVRAIQDNLICTLAQMLWIMEPDEYVYTECQPLFMAAMCSNLDTAQALIEAGANVNSVYHFWITDTPSATLSTSRKAFKDVTLLMYAAQYSDEHMVTFLLDGGINMVATDSDCWTAVHYAAHFGADRALKVLLQRGPSLEVQQESGWTALHLAAYSGHVNCVSLLLQYGSEVDACTNHGSTALMLAAKMGHSECIKLLCKNGASLACTDKSGRTVLHSAAAKDQSKVTQLLLEYGAQSLINDVAGNSYTPLMNSAYFGHLETAKVLLNLKPASNFRDSEGDTALDLGAAETRSSGAIAVACGLQTWS